MKKKNIFWGILLIICSIFLIVGKLGFLGDINPLTLFFTAILFLIFVKGIVTLSFPLILFPIAFCCILYDEILGITALTPWTVLLAALLGSIGLSLIFKRGWIIEHMPFSHKHSSKYNNYFSNESGASDENRVKFETCFGSSVRYINCSEFEYANLSVGFGEMEVFFDNAIIHNGNACVEVSVGFGEMRLYIPKTWNVINDAEAKFGDIKEEGIKQPSENAPNLHLIGSIGFGDLTITYI